MGWRGLLIATLMSAVISAWACLRPYGAADRIHTRVGYAGLYLGNCHCHRHPAGQDFFGLNLASLPEHWWQKVMALADAMPALDPAATAVALATLAVLIFWPRLRLPIPGHLPALMVGLAVAWAMGLLGHSVETIGSRFSYLLPDGTLGCRHSAVFPRTAWPWIAPAPVVSRWS